MRSRLARATSSAGLGGIGPAVIMSRCLLIPDGRICCFICSSLGLSFTSRFVIPRAVSFNSKSSPNRGLRMSRPISNTFLPSRANDMAKLPALKVFPSPELVDVHMITFCPSFIMKSRLVRIERNISSIMLFLFS